MFAKSYISRKKISHHAGEVSYTPPQIAKAYNFPIGFNGLGQKVAFIELGGGFVQSDLNSYFDSLGLKSPTVQFVSVDGGTNSPSNPNSADGEVMLDLCVAIGLANGITPIVYGASNTEQGFVDAVARAVQDQVDCISISWGAPERNWSSAGIQAMNTAFQKAIAANITVTVAAGDNGSSDGGTGNNADFPASSPYVTGCGGTSLTTNNGNVTLETVWNDGSQGGATGGGISALFTLPAWQKNAGVPGGVMRGVPDVAAVADPATGFAIIVDGQPMVVGGTSAVAPFWAALTAILNQGTKKRLGFLNSILYASNPYVNNLFRDITNGNNGTYIAKTGWDACTGLGVPQATNLLNYLIGNSSSSSNNPSSSSSTHPSSSSSASSVEVTFDHSVGAGTYTLVKK